MKQIIEIRFPENTILDGELVDGYDGKLRYSPQVRQGIYGCMKQWIRRRCANVRIYLCMEEKAFAVC